MYGGYNAKGKISESTLRRLVFFLNYTTEFMFKFTQKLAFHGNLEFSYQRATTRMK